MPTELKSEMIKPIFNLKSAIYNSLTVSSFDGPAQNLDFWVNFCKSIAENLIFLFQPAYSPEVNPIERLWLEIKKELKWEIFDDLDKLRKSLQNILINLMEFALQLLGGWKFTLKALSLVGIRKPSQQSPNSLIPLYTVAIFLEIGIICPDKNAEPP